MTSTEREKQHLPRPGEVAEPQISPTLVSISRRMIIYIVLASSAITLVLTSFQLFREYRMDLSEIDRQFLQIERVHLKSVAETLWAADHEKLETLLEGLANLANVVHVSIMEKNRELLSVGSTNSINVTTRIFPLTYTYRGEPVEFGALRVQADLDVVYQSVLDKAVVILIGNAIKTALVVALMVLIIQQVVTRHLQKISLHIRSFSIDGSFVPLTLSREQNAGHTYDELDLVVTSINDTSSKLFRAVAEVRSSEERFRNLFENTEVSIWSEDFSEVCKALDQLREDGVTDLRAYLEQNEQAAWDMATMVKVNHVNHATLRLFKADSEEEFIESIDKVFGSDAIQVFIGELCAIWNKEKFYRSEAAHMTLDGERLDVIISMPIPESVEGFKNVPVSILDITERKQAEELNRNNAAMFEMWKSSNFIGIIHSNASGDILEANDTIINLLGYSRVELLEGEVRWTGITPPEFRHLDLKALEEAGEKGFFSPFEKEYLHKDGSRVPILIGGSRIRENPDEFIVFIVDLSERKRLEEKFRSAFEHVTVGNIIIDQSGIIESLNPAARDIFGYSADEVIGQNIKMLMPESYASEHDAFLQKYAETGLEKIIGAGREVVGLRKSGKTFPMHLGIGKISVGDKKSFIGSVVDLTEREELESRLRQSQKLESVGQLTGGIAHDFNNILGVILGNADLLNERLAADEHHYRRLIAPIIQAAERGAELTRGLLAFSRKQPLDPKVIDLHLRVNGMLSMLRRVLSENIEIETVHTGGLWHCLVDPSQVENALLNLAINARDAMPDGGKLTIETANVRLSDDYVATQADVKSGQYVMLAVSDTGTGMSPEVIERAFEPFFTTKDLGRGTGLGLSMVYGFARQSSGHAAIYSEPGQGTTVKLYLPRSINAAVDKVQPVPGAIPQTRNEIILVVEDDEEVRKLTVLMLSELGYRIIEAGTGESALTCLEQEPHIDLLLSDVVIPGQVTGVALARQATVQHAGIKTMFMSGYTENAIIHQGRLDPGVILLQKPFTKSQLALKVRKTLDMT